MVGLNLGVGFSDLAPDNGNGGDSETAMGASYTAGNFTLGANHNEYDYGATASSDVDNQHYGVSYAVNDDLTLSYGRHESTAESKDTAEVDNEAESIQVSYSMGGASIKFAETSVDNASYNSANDWDGTTVALSLAF